MPPVKIVGNQAEDHPGETYVTTVRLHNDDYHPYRQRSHQPDYGADGELAFSDLDGEG